MKKTLKVILIILVALIVVFVALVALIGSNDSDTTKNMTPEEIKTTAGEKDLEIARSVWSAQQYQVKLADKVQTMGTGETDLLDVYSYAGETKDFVGNLLTTVKTVDMADGTAAEYQDAAEGYISTVYMIANDLRDYIDNEKHSSLEAVKKNLQIIPTAETQFLDARTAYLKDAGYTDEEIAQRPTLDSGENK